MLCYHFPNYFKKYYPADTQQFKRLAALHLPFDDIKKLFAPADSIRDFNIMFGLDSIDASSDKYSFRPIITANYNKSPVAYFEFKEGNDPDPSQDTDVPFEFKEWLTTNWLQMENSSLFNAFVASFEAEKSVKNTIPGKSITMRLHGYNFSESINATFFKLVTSYKSSIQKIILHLGVDFNKSSHKDFFDFSPIIEVRIAKLTNDDFLNIHRLGLRSYMIDPYTDSVNKDGIVYIEYMSPCPSSCSA